MCLRCIHGETRGGVWVQQTRGGVGVQQTRGGVSGGTAADCESYG